MGMKKNITISIFMTIVTTVLLGLIYPLVMTGISQVLFRDKANGQLISRDGKMIGSKIIGQAFTGPTYFHSRPSAAGAGNGYDAANSGGTDLAPTNHALIDRVKRDTSKLQAENPNAPVPVDLVTTSASGLDPHITPAAALFQVPRVARERGMNEEDLRRMVNTHIEGRQLGVLGEPRINVLQLNLDLDARKPMTKTAKR
jgi:K+-transporting ATPase ATPase C chain